MTVDGRGLRRRAVVAVVALALAGVMGFLGSATEASAHPEQRTTVTGSGS